MKVSDVIKEGVANIEMIEQLIEENEKIKVAFAYGFENRCYGLYVMSKEDMQLKLEGIKQDEIDKLTNRVGDLSLLNEKLRIQYEERIKLMNDSAIIKSKRLAFFRVEIEALPKRFKKRFNKITL